MTCGHPLTAVVRDPAGVEVCAACSPDVTTPSTQRATVARPWWARPPGRVVVPRGSTLP